MDSSASMSVLRALFLESAKALPSLRSKESIREKLLDLIFDLMPTDRAAVRVDNSLVVRGGEISRHIVDRVFQDGKPVLSDGIICVPMDGHAKHRLGALYAQGSDPEKRLNITHLHLLAAVAAFAAMIFENAAYIEVLRDENLKLERDLWLQRDLIGASPAMAELSRIIAKAAPTNSTVLIRNCGISEFLKLICGELVQLAAKL